MRLSTEHKMGIAFWENEFNEMKRTGNPKDIVSIDYEFFSADLLRTGLYNLFLNTKEIQEIFELDDSEMEDYHRDTIQRFPNKMTFTNTRTMAEFVVLNVLPFFEGKVNTFNDYFSFYVE